jgi:hypothetical protein
VVFRKDTDGIVEIAATAARLIRELAASQPKTDWRFEYSPETFTATELGFAKTICDAVTEIWQPTPERKAIMNLPATSRSPVPTLRRPDQWMHRNLARRDAVVLSLHRTTIAGPGRGRRAGTLAGGDRIEGRLFGNGERTGNVDLCTLALNLYTGHPPRLDSPTSTKSGATSRSATSCRCTRATLRRRSGVHGIRGLAPGRDQKGFRRAAGRRAGTCPTRSIRPTWAQLRRGHPGQQPVGQGGVAYLLGPRWGRAAAPPADRAGAHRPGGTDSSGKEIPRRDHHLPRGT